MSADEVEVGVEEVADDGPRAGSRIIASHQVIGEGRLGENAKAHFRIEQQTVAAGLLHLCFVVRGEDGGTVA